MLNYMYNNEFETEKNEKHWIKDKNHSVLTFIQITGILKLALMNSLKSFTLQLPVNMCSSYLTHLRVPFSS